MMKIKAEEAHEPKSGHEKPAPAAPPGNERKADMKGALDGGGDLGGAVRELHKQHPYEYDDHGPHHGTDDHIRHERLHGMKPGR
jgi:hypothetical protein